jgi:excisionase family DNA binding protein
MGYRRRNVEALLVKIPDAVRATGISRSRLYELMAAGDIEALKVGSSRLVVVESLRTWVERQRITAGR